MTSEDARIALGRQVRDARQEHGISIETAAERGGIGHMSWRKIERGHEVRQRTYVGVDRAFGWSIGHTPGCLEMGHDLRASTPPETRGARLGAAAIGTDTEPKQDPSEDPLTVTLENIERLSLAQLEGLQLTIQHMTRDRRAMLDEAESTLERDRANSDFYFGFNGRYLFETSRDVGAQYESAFQRYMEERLKMSEFQQEIGQAERGEVPSKKYLTELSDRISKHSKELNRSIEQLRNAEEAAVYDLHQDNNVSVGGTDGMDS